MPISRLFLAMLRNHVNQILTSYTYMYVFSAMTEVHENEIYVFVVRTPSLVFRFSSSTTLKYLQVHVITLRFGGSTIIRKLVGLSAVGEVPNRRFPGRYYMSF